jgi:hypothetical protein
MPATTAVYEPTDKDLNVAAAQERKARLDLINAYWLFYKQGYVREPLKVKPGKPNDNVILNLSGLAIDSLVAFFACEPPTFQIAAQTVEREPGADGSLEVVQTPEETAIEAFLDANDFDELLVDTALSGFISGHNFIKLMPPDNTDDISAENPPRMALLDPRMVTVFWDGTNARNPLWYRLEWEAGKDTSGKARIRRQDIVPTWIVMRGDMPDMARGWMIIEYVSKNGSSEQFEMLTVDNWQYPFSPIVQWKDTHAPHEFYGWSTLRYAALNEAVNFIASNTARIIKFHAHPKTVVKNLSADGLNETAVDGLWEIKGDNADVTNLEMQSDLSSSLTYLNTLRAAFFTQMRVVDVASIQDKLGQITNFGVRMIYKQQLDAVETKRTLYSKKGFCEVLRRALVMMGFADAPLPTAIWADPLPANRVETVAALTQEAALGVTSKQTLAEDLGRDPEVEQERMAEEETNAAEATANTLAAMGNRGIFK